MLRAKYLDWCSAQVADQFLALSPDEIFELAERAATGGEASSTGRSLTLVPRTDAELSDYRALVEQVTEVLAAQAGLPSFSEWLEMYRSSPQLVESQLLGFWKDVDGVRGSDPEG